MNIHEKAKAYAEGKAIEAISQAIEQAYEAGYQEGYREGSEKQCNEAPVVLQDDNTEYVDLGLPSGTLWSSDYLKEDGKNVYLPYCQAVKYNIPTEEQFNELKTKCQIIAHYNGNAGFYTIIGPNGNSIDCKIDVYYKGNVPTFNTKVVSFWLKEETENNERISKPYARLSECNRLIQYFFSGFKLPIRLVRK